MKTIITRSLVAGAAGIIAAVSYSPAANAQAASTAGQTYQANLVQQNKSGASGTATVSVSGNNVTVNIRATGLSPNLAHAQHLHVGGQATCPTPAADTDKDGFVNSKEGEASVGPIRVSLTTTGDVGSGSALAVDRMPKADAQGNLTYTRTFALPSGVAAADLARATVEQHGISALFNDKAKYDGDKKSELDSKLPFETTAPATCGKLTSAPTGGLATGAGSINGIESPVILAAGTAAVLAALVLAFRTRRPLNGSRF